MSALIELIKKEVKETFRNPRYLIFTILFPLILFPAIGYLYSFSFQTFKERVSTATVLIINHDNGELSNLFIRFLNESLGIRTVLGTEVDINNSRYLAAIVIPEDFSSKLNNQETPKVTIYSRLGSVSFTSMGIARFGQSLISRFENLLRESILRDKGLDPNFFNHMISTEEYVYVEEWRKIVPTSFLNTMAIQVYFVPWLIFGLIISILQVSAAMLSEEKEYKTLETLLTLPIDRKVLALEKIIGSMIVALAATAAYVVGFAIYFFLGSNIFLNELTTFEFKIDASVLAVITILFFLTTLITGGLGLIISLFTQDTKTAESLTGGVSMPLLFLVLMGSFIDISSLPGYVLAIYYSLPYTYLMKSFEYLLIGRYDMFLIGIGVNILWLIGILIILARMFNSERLLTMKISFRRKKKTQAEDQL